MRDDYDYVADYQEWKRQRDQLRRLYIICGIVAACNIGLLVVLWR